MHLKPETPPALSPPLRRAVPKATKCQVPQPARPNTRPPAFNKAGVTPTWGGAFPTRSTAGCGGAATRCATPRKEGERSLAAGSVATSGGAKQKMEQNARPLGVRCSPRPMCEVKPRVVGPKARGVRNSCVRPECKGIFTPSGVFVARRTSEEQGGREGFPESNIIP